MPIMLSAPTITGNFSIYRDPGVSIPLSSLTWDNPLSLGRVLRSAPLRQNLFPNGSFEVADNSNLDYDRIKLTSSFETTWAAGGQRSLKLTPVTSHRSTIKPPGSMILAGTPGARYSFGMTVRNYASVEKPFTLTATLGSLTASRTISIPPTSFSRLEVLNQECPVPSGMESISGIGLVYFTPLSFTLSSDDFHSTSQPFAIDDIFVGPGASAAYFPFVQRSVYEDSFSGEPIRVWIQNDSSVSMKLTRVHASAFGADSPRIWIDATQDPALSAWESAYNRAVVINPGILLSGQSASFWIRPVSGENVSADAFVRMLLRVNGDPV